ncbi:reverse transcriptase domain-containing protein [Tanacetum coccineum]
MIVELLKEERNRRYQDSPLMYAPPCSGHQGIDLTKIVLLQNKVRSTSARQISFKLTHCIIGIEVDVGVDVVDEVEDEVESSDRGTMEVGVDMAARIDIPDAMLMPDAVERLEQVEEVEEALAAYEATRAANALEAESQSQNGNNIDNGNGGNGNGGNGNSGDGNGGDGNGRNRKGGNGNPNENNRDARLVVRECTYQDFMKCQPLNLKGTEGGAGLTRWFEKIETVFHISNCPEKYQVKYATCTLLNSALTWWNSHTRTVGTDTAFAMSWRELMKLMAEVYCPRNEIQKMESELKMVPKEEDQVERYIGGLLDNI